MVMSYKFIEGDVNMVKSYYYLVLFALISSCGTQESCERTDSTDGGSTCHGVEIIQGTPGPAGPAGKTGATGAT